MQPRAIRTEQRMDPTVGPWFPLRTVNHRCASRVLSYHLWTTQRVKDAPRIRNVGSIHCGNWAAHSHVAQLEPRNLHCLPRGNANLCSFPSSWRTNLASSLSLARGDSKQFSSCTCRLILASTFSAAKAPVYGQSIASRALSRSSAAVPARAGNSRGGLDAGVRRIAKLTLRRSDAGIGTNAPKHVLVPCQCFAAFRWSAWSRYCCFIHAAIQNRSKYACMDCRLPLAGRPICCASPNADSP